ncbi:hypothetical protein [Legionella yabuuchiae]|uniref:hypothetical protein n=1 Tax=Legionella yabuuchiae TaxID=376727 RepID=UPI0013EFA806|nr:hypothetical protein [Legionella yabuuchiae]
MLWITTDEGKQIRCLVHPEDNMKAKTLRVGRHVKLSEQIEEEMEVPYNFTVN